MTRLFIVILPNPSDNWNKTKSIRLFQDKKLELHLSSGIELNFFIFYFFFFIFCWTILLFDLNI